MKSNVKRKLATRMIMTPSHPRWEEFCEYLAGPRACNMDGGVGESEGCDASTRKPYAREILKEMGGFDIPTTIEFFESHGGYCDCEILLNVAAFAEELASELKSSTRVSIQ